MPHLPSTLSPAVPATLPFLESLYDELLPNFTSALFNVGCDETFELGLGRSQALVARRGKGRVYLDFLLKICELVSARGRTMQFWSDILNRHPELIPELPKDAIALEWNYEAGYDFLGKTAPYAAAGIPFYVCPSTSAMRAALGRTDNCLANLREAARQGLANGAIGYLNTNWGDTWGWRRWLPLSYLGIAYGAAISWACEANSDLNLPAAPDAHVFRDRASGMGKLVFDLGNVYQKPGVLQNAGSLLYSLQLYSLANLRQRAPLLFHAGESQRILFDDELLRANLHSAVEYITDLMTGIGVARMQRPDADLIKREFSHMAQMAQHGARRGLLQLGDRAVTRASMRADLAAIEYDFPGLWLARNRAGGLAEAMRLLNELRPLYADATS